ncbi:MAG: ABC transporter ATP-binding protein, partial [Halobacteria archaeon]|nr:ABC transporter ATP-binding protein [Halobacteria archaeon]
ASGLNPSEISSLSNTIKDIRADLNVSVFWIEHVMEAIMGTTDRIIVLNNGKKIAEGTPREIRNNEQVSEAYLGEQNI